MKTFGSVCICMNIHINNVCSSIYVMAQGGWVLPDLYLLASVGTEEVTALVIRYSGQYRWDIFRFWEPCLGMPVEQLLVSEGSSLPSSSSPLSHLNSLFWQSCWDPLNKLLQDGQDCHIWNNFDFSSSTAQLHWQNEWYSWPSDLLHQSHLRFLGPLHLKTQPLLPLLALHLSSLQFQHFPLW